MIKFKSAQETNWASNLFWFLWHEVTGDIATFFLNFLLSGYLLGKQELLEENDDYIEGECILIIPRST